MSVFRESLVFFERVGLYDVVLPFLLIFTLMFGVLEKSKILGTEHVGDKQQSRKNLNAMVSFVTSFFVVSSVQLVELIHVLVARVAVILVILVMLMILIASMHIEQDDKGFSLEGWKGWLSVVVLIAVVLIFLDGVSTNGVSWLDFIYGYLMTSWNSTFAGTLFLFLILIGFVFWLTKDNNKADS